MANAKPVRIGPDMPGLEMAPAAGSEMEQSVTPDAVTVAESQLQPRAKNKKGEYIEPLRDAKGRIQPCEYVSIHGNKVRHN